MTWLYVIGYLLIGVVVCLAVTCALLHIGETVTKEDSLEACLVIVFWPLFLLAICLGYIGFGVISLGRLIYYAKGRKRK